MALTAFGQFKVYDPRIQGGFVETITQNIAVLNENSRNALKIVTQYKAGHFDYEAFFKNADLVSRRDVTSGAAADDIQITQDEFIAVKLNRKIGPAAITFDAMKKIGMELDEDALNFTAGQMAARDVIRENIHSGLLSSIASLRAMAATSQLDVTGVSANSGQLNTDAMINGHAKMGDQAGRVVCWVMHSDTYFRLVGNQYADKVFGVANINVASGMPVTLGKPVVVVDDPALKVTVGAGSTAYQGYYTLGLVEEAVTMNQAEQETIMMLPVLGVENMALRMQGEYAYDVRVKGMKWDVANGGINPTATALATSTNWDKAVTSHKDGPGFLILHR